MRTRVAAAIDRIVAAHPAQRVAVVAHGGAINAFVAHALDIHRTMFMTVENTSITLVRINAITGTTMISANDCHHLNDPVVGPPG